MTTKKPPTNEVSRVDHGKAMSAAYVYSLIQNPDTLLASKGGSLEPYKDLLRDDQVKAAYQQRRLGVTQCNWSVEPASESGEDQAVAEFVKEALERIDFDRITSQMLFGIFYGYSVGEIMWENEAGRIFIQDIKVRDRDRFRFNKNSELVLRQGAGREPKVMPRDKFWVFSHGSDNSDNPYGEALAHSLYWPVFFKRNGVRFWMIFLEKFGMPTIAAKLSAADYQVPEKRAMALDIIDAVQADSGVVIPESFALDVVEASRSGTVDYETLKTAMDKSISKVILGQTMTVDDGSSHSQAQVHQGVKSSIVKSDADALSISFNQDVVKQLVLHNFGPDVKPPTVWRRAEPEIDLKEVAERDNKIMSLGYEPTEEYIRETYGEGWVKKEVTDPVPPTGPAFGPMGPEFSEVSSITEGRIQHRKNQEAIAVAAGLFAQDYNEHQGKRLREILDFAETAGDLDEVKKKIEAMMRDPAPEESVKALSKATFAARLMGLLKGQR